MRTSVILLALIGFLQPSAPALAQGLNMGAPGANSFIPPLSLYRPGEATPPLGAMAAEMQRLDVIEVLTNYFSTLMPRPGEAPLIRSVFLNGDRASAQVETRLDLDRFTHAVHLRLFQGQWQVVRLTTAFPARR